MRVLQGDSGVEMALAFYDIGVEIWYDDEPKTVKEGLGTYTRREFPMISRRSSSPIK